jgi:hypothetical protein
MQKKIMHRTIRIALPVGGKTPRAIGACVLKS